MQRLTSLIALCLFTLLFCSVASDLQKENSFSPENNEEPTAHPVEKYFHLVEKKAIFRRNPGLSFRAGEKQPDLSTALPEKKEIENDKAGPAEEPETAAAENPPLKKERPPAGLLPGEEKNSIHFLLIGRWWEDPAAEVLMIVTLVPEGCARLTALDPATGVELEKKPCPIGELLERGGSRDQLYLAVTSLTGLTPQFYIDLNLHGFVEMIALLQKEGRGGASSRSGTASPPETGFDGNEVLLLLNDASLPTATKEEMLVELLLAACEIQFTRLGLKLLWMGYHNLKTDLSLRDLLEVRKVTQGISPTDVSLTEITP